MYNLSASTLSELDKDLKNNKVFVEEFMFMTELKVALSIWEIIRSSDVSQFKITVIKEEYNDEGLDVGVYCDISTSSLDFLSYQDYEYEYNREYRTRMNPKDHKIGSPEHKCAQWLHDLNESLCQILFDKNLPFAPAILSNLESVVMQNDLDSIIVSVCGPKKHQEWKIRRERQEISDKVASPLASQKNVAKSSKKI